MKIYNLGIGQYPTQTTFWGLDFWSNICHAKDQNPFAFHHYHEATFSAVFFNVAWDMIINKVGRMSLFFVKKYIFIILETRKTLFYLKE